MISKLLPLAALMATALFFSSCGENDEPSVSSNYTVPTTYNFNNVNYTKSTHLVKMTVELNAYLSKANAGSAVVPLDQAVVNNMFANTNSPFANADLNASSFSISSFVSEGALYKSYADSVLIFNTGVNASAGVGGFVPRNANKIVVSPTGLEYSQAYAKGTMGALLFKEAMLLLSNVKTMGIADTLAAQAAWDEAFGYLSVPTNYDATLTYVNSDPNRPLLWGGYLAERGIPIQAGSTIFGAFLKGRAAIGAYDVDARNEQADIILEKWEQLAAIAVLSYVTAPTASSNIGNYGSQFHELSEGFGFIASLKYRPSSSKLTAANFATLNRIIHTDFYVLLGQPGFTDLVTAQNILKSTYGL